MSWQAVDAVLEYSRAKGAARMVAIVLASHADRHGRNTHPSVSTIKREANLGSRSTVVKALEQLLALAEIECTETRGRGNRVFRFTLPISTGPASGPVNRSAGLPVTGPASGPDAEHPTGPLLDATGPLSNGIGPASGPEPLGTVRRTEPPLMVPPKGGHGSRRARDRDRLETEQRAWAAEYFPEFEPRAVISAIWWADRRGAGGATVETVRAELERLATSEVA